MNDFKKDKDSTLAALIEKSAVISSIEKKEFMDLLPSLDERQKDKLVSFFTSAEKELEEIRVNVEQEKGRIRADFLAQIDIVIKNAGLVASSMGLIGKFNNI